MNREEPNPASAQEKAEGSRENVNVDFPSEKKKRKKKGGGPNADLPGKVDSGPEPEVHGREIPPQD